MKTVIPSYYRKFHCTGSSCRHNCCREGWEIGIDDSHVTRYKELILSKTEISERLKEGTYLPTARERKEGKRPYIRLSEDGICPFLNQEGLCDLILTFGEDILCQICADHPRFRNYGNGQVETGLGLCCEEAARLLLESADPFSYELLQNGEKVKLPYISEARKAVELSERKNLDISEMIQYLLSLDSLEGNWKEWLKSSIPEESNRKEPLQEDYKVRIREYLIFRHYRTCGETFIAFCMKLIDVLYRNANVLQELEGKERIIEILRVFSSEIEYSEEAPDLITGKLKKLTGTE